MNAEEIKRRVLDIEAIREDDECAHSKEDSLHQAVLVAIRDGTCDDPVKCAAAALKTLDIKFARWCA